MKERKGILNKIETVKPYNVYGHIKDGYVVLRIPFLNDYEARKMLKRFIEVPDEN